MTSTVTGFIDDMSTEIAALVSPTDGSNLGYKLIAEPSEAGGKGQHRQFFWEPAEDPFNWVDGSGPLVSTIAWPILLNVFLHRGNRPSATWTKDWIEDVKTIIRLWVRRHDAGFGGAGIRSAILRSVRWSKALERVTFRFTVNAQEVD